MGELKGILIEVIFVKIGKVRPRVINLKGKKWMSRDTIKYRYKKKEDMDRRNKKQKREQEKRLWKRGENRIGEVSIWKKSHGL